MIIFRTDGNVLAGAGHVMRCISIANCAKELGEQSLFVCSSGEFELTIREAGHVFLNLNSDFTKLVPGDIFEVFELYEPSVVFVDSYYVTEEYLSRLHKICRIHRSRLVYIDDRCAFAYPCDFILNYNIFGSINDYKRLFYGKEKPSLMIGPNYAPLRKEFQGGYRRNVIKQAKRILVSTGGSDSKHLAVDLIEKAIEETAYSFCFVLGKMTPDKKRIIDISKKGKNIVISENVKRMDKLMISCDIAISAAGSTLYELCATQTPSITYVLEDNQIPAAKEFEARNIMKNCGDVRVLGNRMLADKLINEAIVILHNYEERKRMSEIMGNVVDGLGSVRILQQVLK